MTVFATGAVILVLEIVGSRILAPFFGSTQYVWSSLIAVTMLALAMGYWMGGRLADSFDPFPVLFRLLTAAGWLVLLLTLIRGAVLKSAIALGLGAGALVASLILLAPPLTALGCVAPLAAKIAVGALEHLGLKVGGLYALSTLGSLLGALAAGFALVPVLGVGKILFLCALLLFLPSLYFWVAAPRTSERRFLRFAAGLGLIVCMMGLAARQDYPVVRGDEWAVLHKSDSSYGEVKVVQHRSARILLLDGAMQTGIEMESHLPVFSYASAIPALALAANPKARKVLLIGFGGGIVAETFALQGLSVESVEIDPEVVKAARRYFVRRDDLPVTEEDGRTYLARSPAGRFDIVILDAYAGEAPPAHLFTVETYAMVRRVLAPGGIGVANLITFTSGNRAKLLRCVGRTIRSVFPWVSAYAVEESRGAVNVLCLFSDKPRRPKRLADIPMLGVVADRIKGMLERRIELDFSDAFPLTDDYNPIETMALAARGGMRRHIVDLFPGWVLLQ